MIALAAAGALVLAPVAGAAAEEPDVPTTAASESLAGTDQNAEANSEAAAADAETAETEAGADSEGAQGGGGADSAAADGTGDETAGEDTAADDTAGGGDAADATTDETSDAGVGAEGEDSSTAPAEDVALQAAQVSAKVKVSGKPVIGSKLKAVSSVKKPEGLATTASYTWYVSGKKVATGATYKVRTQDFKRSVRVVAKHSWAANDVYEAGSAKAKSPSIKKVAKRKASVTAKVKISGSPKAGSTLVAKASAKRPNGLKATGSYVWYANGKRIGGGQALRVQPRHSGAAIKVVYTIKWSSKTYASGSKKASSTKRIKVHKPTRIVSKARSQLGVQQDCTALVEKSLRHAGVRAGDLGTRTAEYTRLGGKVVGSPQPGDVLVWNGRHVAVYIGNGKAVHGGFNGSNTVIASWTVIGKPQIVRYA